MKAKKVLEILGIHRVTLCRYVKEGRIRAKKLPNTTYDYNDDDVYKMAGLENKRHFVIYSRVSTHKQKNDLENQTNAIKSFMSAKGIKTNKVYTDIKSGMTLDRKGFMELLADVQANKIDTVFITYKDRLARLSYELVVKLFDKHNVRIETIYNDKKTDEQELFEDLMQIIHGFSMKMYSKRRLAKKLIGESNE
jgi:predicted site-specific integrase-resolvase